MVIAVSVAVAAFVLLCIFTGGRNNKAERFEVEIATAEKIEPLVEEAPESEAEVSTPLGAVSPEIPIEFPEVKGMEVAEAPRLSVPVQENLRPIDMQTVALIKSPVMMKTISGSCRSASGKRTALGRFGGSDAGESAVIRALRYLQKQQSEDGSWKFRGEGDATAFALLAFLAHGEDFASDKFGKTVRKAVEYLLKHHNNNMATYALAEAAGIIRTPALMEAANTAVMKMIKRKKHGKINANRGGAVPRYCAVMAMKAAKIARLSIVTHCGGDAAGKEATAQLKEAYLEMRDNLAEGKWKLNGEGVWHYMIAVTCLQYLGHGEDPNTLTMLKRLEAIWPPATLGASEIACCPVRSNYFATTIFFNEGGETWKRWNEGMKAAYVKQQTIVGDCGFWTCQDKHIGEQPFWTTCYIVQQLMSYYRYLPTKGEDKEGERGKAKNEKAQWETAIEVEVEFGITSP